MGKEIEELEKKWNEHTKVKSATIGFYHQDCQTSKSSEKFPNVRLDEISPVVYLDKKPGKIDYLLVWNVSADKPSEVDEYLSYIKKNNDTKKLTVLEKGGNQALILLRAFMPSSSYEKVLQSGAMPTKDVFVKQGYETYNLIAPDPNSIQKLAKELECIGDVKILRVGDYRQDIGGPILTHKQRDALSVALMNGYYSWPRKVGLVEMARAAHTSRRSLQERLRRAEAKLFPNLVKDYLEKRGKA